MTENYFDSIMSFFGKFIKFALFVFTGAFIIVGIVWIIFAIFEWIYIGISCIKDYISGDNPDKTKALTHHTNVSVRCPKCHMLVPGGPRCHICGTRLSAELQPVPINKSTEVADTKDISVVQYSERKKYQKIKCPYCNSLSTVINETYGAQTRKCRNGHIFVYDYESEMLIQDDLNAKYK